MSNALTVQQKFDTVKDLLTSKMMEIRGSIPSHLTPDRLRQVALSSVRKNPKLLEADPRTLVSQVCQCATLGLEPDDVLGQAYLLPFNNRKLGTVDVQLIIGYKGLIDLARRSGQVKTIAAYRVYANDEFKVVYGLHPDIKHTPILDPAKRGAFIGVYAVCNLMNGGVQFVYMSKPEVDEIKKHSRGAASSDSPWTSHYESMADKTALRRLCKMLPLSPEVARAVALDEHEELVGPAIDITPEEPPKEPIKLADKVKSAERKKEHVPDPAPVAETPDEVPPPDDLDAPFAPEPDLFEAVTPQVGIWKDLYDLLACHCKGDMVEMRKLFEMITEYKGQGMQLENLNKASESRLKFAILRLRELENG